MGRVKYSFGVGGVVLIVLLFSSLPFFCIGAWEGGQVWYESQTFKTAEGEVVQNVLLTSEDLDDFTRESSAYHPVIRFRTQLGTVSTFTSGSGSYPARYEIGDKVTVMYDPANPSEARIRSWEIWFPPILFMVIGVLPVAIGGGIMLFLQRSVQKQVEEARAAR